ncbi:MAG TPA: right-handed parallel beta-helix repeat-containing protein [Pseudonocardiaceae bacterium]
MSSFARTVWMSSALLLFTAGCGTVAGQNSSTADQRQQSLPPGCTHTITRADEVPATLSAASRGDLLCFSGSDFTATDVTMATSGTADAPIRLASDGGTVHSIHVNADNVVVEGFTVAGGDGILLEGAGLTARNNTVHDTQQGGIGCDSCTDSTIESNTVTHVSTVGIEITGQRITVKNNTVSGTVAVNDGDADGMRFFGNGHRITGNTIRDISARGYSAPPHPDCFQTFDHNPSTFDVVISGNTCRNVDAQCLIATDDQPGDSGAPAGSVSISFVGNICASNGAQAVNLRHWTNVELRQNQISGPHLVRGILIEGGSTGATVIGNTTAGGVPTVEVDDASRPGFRNSPA